MQPRDHLTTEAMIDFDKLGELKLERISPTLNRKKWDLPLSYDLEYLGGFYENPVSLANDGPVGIGLNFGSKTGDKIPVTVELGCSKGVTLPGARHMSFEFHEPAARRANELCRLLGLPPVLGELALNPLETWRAAFPEGQCRILRNYNGFGVVVERSGAVLKLYVSSLPPLQGPRYISAELFDLKGVAKNCPKRERAEMLSIVREEEEETVRGREFLDAVDFIQDKASKYWVWRFPVHNPLGDFRLELQVNERAALTAGDGLLTAAMNLLLAAEYYNDHIQDLVYGDYHRHEAQHPEALTATDVPSGLKRKAMGDLVAERTLIIRPTTTAKGQSYSALARVRPKWRGKEPLDFHFEKGAIVSIDGKPFELKDQILWCQGDKKLKPKPPGTVSPEFQAMASVIRMMPFQIEKTKAPRPLSARLKKLMATATDAGFVQLGWLEVTMPLPVTIAAFADADGGIMLSIATSLLLESESVDLVSHLDGNRKLTTTTFEMVMPQPNRGIFKFSHTKATIPQLLKKHAEHLRELKGTIQTRVKSLDDFAQAIRDYLKQENQT